jgi:hypothetical protein
MCVHPAMRGRAYSPAWRSFWPGGPNHLEGDMIIGPKRPRWELTFARLSAIEIEPKRFLELRRGKAPSKSVSWSSVESF